MLVSFVRPSAATALRNSASSASASSTSRSAQAGATASVKA